MPLSPETAGQVHELISQYLDSEEVLEAAEYVELSFDEEPGGTGAEEYADDMVRLALRRIDYGQNRLWLASLLKRADMRNSDLLARSDWDRQDHHRRLRASLEEVRPEIEEGAAPGEIALEAGQEFTAPSEVRERFARADDELFVVDRFVNTVTLDCFRTVTVPIRLLTGTRDDCIKGEFDRSLQAFRDEGRSIEVRRHPGLHDRHAVYNDRCLLIGSSLKHAGQKPFHAIPIRNAAGAVIEVLEEYWQEAEEYEI